MKITKRIVTLFLILTMIVTGAGCSRKRIPQVSSGTNTQQEQAKADSKKEGTDNADTGKNVDTKDISVPEDADSDEKTNEMAGVDEKDNSTVQRPPNNTSHEENSAVKPEAKETIALSIAGDNSVVPDNGVILSADIKVSDGDTVYSVLERTCKKNGILLDTEEYDGILFINGINSIVNFDNGPMSGWVFKVNGIVPDAYAEDYQVQPGDVVEWYYTCDFSTFTG